MEVQVAESGPCRHTLTITIPPEGVREHIDAAFRQASQQVQLKGFRDGKVPRSVIEKRFGDAIRAEAKERLINESFRNACAQKDLSVVGRPEIEGVDETPLSAEESVEFKVHVDVRPTIELKSVKGLDLEVQDTAVNDEDVDAALAQLADQKKTLQSVDEPSVAGDFVKLDMTFLDTSGNEVHKREGAQLNTNIPILGIEQEEFSAKLVGIAKDGEAELPITFPDNFEKEEVRGQEGKVQLKVHEVLRVQPPAIDDQLAKDFDYESLEKLREDLQGRIGEEKERAEKHRQEESLIESALALHPFPLPSSLVQDQANHQLAGFEQRLREGGKLSDDEVKSKLDEARPEAEKQAEAQIRRFFMLDTIAREEQVYVTEGDVEDALREIAAQHNASLEDVRQHYENQELIGDLRANLMDRKVREFLRENAKITDNKA